MPREYRTPAGPAAPSPTSFGSSELNLSSPRFVAQTSVAPKENPFAVLQQVLGLATNLGGQVLKYKTEELEGKISYRRAVEAEKEKADAEKRRQEADKRRTESEEAAKFEANLRFRLASANEEEAKAIKAEALKAKEGESTDMTVSRSQVAFQAGTVVRQLETETKQTALDTAAATSAHEMHRILNAVNAANFQDLVGLEKTYADRSEAAASTEDKALWNSLRHRVITERDKLAGESEVTLDREERAAALAAGAVAKQLASDTVTNISQNVLAFEEQLTGSSDDALASATFDIVFNRILEKNPELAAAWDFGSDAEHDAISSAIKSEVDVLSRGVASRRNIKNMQVAEDRLVGRFAAEAVADKTGGTETFNRIDNDTTLSPQGKQKATWAAAAARIDQHDSDIEKLTEIAELRSSFGDDPNIMKVVYRKQREILKGVDNEVALERQQLLAPPVSPLVDGDPAKVGWLSRFNDKDELLTWVLKEKFGTDAVVFQNDPAMRALLGPTIETVGLQWDQDQARTDANIRRSDTEFRRSNPASRRSLTTEQGWKSSPLSMAIADGSYSTLDEGQLTSMVRDSLTGYSDVAVPSDLAKKVVSGYAAPENLALVKAFWNVMQSSNDPTVRTNILDNDEYFKSWAMGAYLRHLDINREVTGETTKALATQFSQNLESYANPSADSPEQTARLNAINASIVSLTSGAGIDTGWFDLTGVEAKDVFKSMMMSSDSAKIMRFATMAASAPDEADKGAFLSSIMRSNGYNLYPVPNDTGGSEFRMVQNVVGRDGTVPLPDPAVMGSNTWTSFLNSKKADIAKALSARRSLDGTYYPYSANDITEVHINPLEIDTIRGKCALKVKSGGRWIRLDATEVSITGDEFNRWSVANKAETEAFNFGSVMRAATFSAP